MRALVVFEPMFGNTRQIAEAVADGLSGAVRTDLVEVSRARRGSVCLERLRSVDDPPRFAVLLGVGCFP